MACIHCCDKDEFDKYIDPPCCEGTGVCTAGYGLMGIGLCECCGAEMFEENDEWFHHEQRDIPYEKRGTRHNGPRKKAE